MTFGPRVQKECEAWARAFALELPIVEEAVTGYVALLMEQSDSEMTDADLAKALADLRKKLSRTISRGAEAQKSAQLLEDMATRLDRSLEHTEVLEEAGLIEELPGLKQRLQAGRALITALRAAIARRAKPSR